MIKRTHSVYLLVVVAALVVAGACGDPAPAQPPAATGPVATPTLQPSTGQPGVQTQARTPTPTPVPEEARAVALEFVSGHRSVDQEWEQFHVDLDTWREALVSCDASSIGITLRQFPAQFIGISETARKLPRDSVVRELSDRLISAAEQEEEALRQLRDTWRPGSEVAFERVDLVRSSAAAAQKAVEDRLSDLEASGDPTAQEQVDDFAKAFQGIDFRWDVFRRNYDSFRSQDLELNSEETVQSLSQLVDEISDIVVSVRQLPATNLTRNVTETLAAGAEAEKLALRMLRGTFEKSEEPAGAQGQRGADFQV